MGQHVPQIFQLLFNGELYEWQTKFYICPTKINIKVVGHMSNYLKITLVRTLVTCLTTAPASQHVHQCTRHPMQAHRHAQTTAPALEHTVFPRSDAAATINFPLLALAATIRGRRLLEGGVNYTLHDSLLFSSINFDYIMFKSTIFGSDYC